MYDVIIVGAGPAGLTAALYSSRREMSTLVISKDLGGQAILTDKIHNYPGIKFSDGISMMKTFKEQAEEYGAQFDFNEVSGVERDGDNFIVRTPQKEYQAKTVILSFGLTPRDMGIEDEDKFKGDTIFCAPTEYSNKFKGKKLAVIGGGNSAFDSVIHLSDYANKIYLVHRRDEFRGEEITLKKIKELKNVEFILNSEVDSLIIDGELKGIKVKDVNSGELSEIEVDGICVNIGYSANTKWLGDLVERTDRGHIKTTRDNETFTPGLFAAGDCTELPYKQIITSGAEGCKAAMKAYEYLVKKEGRRAIMHDWS